MHDAVLAIFLGIVEGLTEFLPVSSTAHLRLAEKMLGIDPTDSFWKMFSIVIQLGAIASLFVYFSGRLVKFMRTFPEGENKTRTFLDHPLTLVMVAFVVTAIPAYLLHKRIGENLENTKVMGWALLIGGVVMWVVDAMYGKKGRTDHVERMSLPQAIWIGACQILSAVFPGTSRSMSTIAAGQVAGMSRSAALEFSFLLSIPTMVVATGFVLYKSTLSKHQDVELAPIHMDGHRWALLGIGMVVSFVVALGVVAWFMGWVRKRGFVPFAIYRILVGAAVLIWMKG